MHAPLFFYFFFIFSPPKSFKTNKTMLNPSQASQPAKVHIHTHTHIHPQPKPLNSQHSSPSGPRSIFSLRGKLQPTRGALTRLIGRDTIQFSGPRQSCTEVNTRVVPCRDPWAVSGSVVRLLLLLAGVHSFHFPSRFSCSCHNSSLRTFPSFHRPGTEQIGRRTDWHAY